MTEQTAEDDLRGGTAASPGPKALGQAGLWRLWQGLTTILEAEHDRWVLWLPVALAVGVTVYFALPVEPPRSAGLAAVAVSSAASFGARRRMPALCLLLGVVAAALGFAAAQERSHWVAAPVLKRAVGPTAVTGRVVGVEALPEGARLILADPRIPRLAAEDTPARLRLRLPARFPAPLPGSEIRLRVMLRPPPPPSAPDAYDFQRAAWFESIGAVGWAVGAPVELTPPPSSPWQSLGIAVERLRGVIAARVAAVVPRPEAAVVAALLNGRQNGIDAATMSDYRKSGLAHILSVSGLHVALVAGLVFFVVRALLALVEPLALRHPIKKWAAVAALVATFAYMPVVGAPAPTLRSVLMHGLVMVALLLDRNPLSMRLVGFAAAVVLLLQPESLLGPSFQMSFGAVAALIATCESMTGRLHRWYSEAGRLGRAGFYLVGSALTSLVATLATTPFSLYHFQQVALYGVFANMLAVPLTSFWVMPWALIAYLLLPFGAEAVALVPMAWGVAGIDAIARVTATLPGASLRFPAMPGEGLLAIVLGGVWLVLWRRRWRWWGAVAVIAGFATVPLAPRPDILVSGDGKLMAVRGADGGLLLSRRSRSSFAVATWLQRDGTDQPVGTWPRVGSSADETLACDQLGCLYRPVDAAGQTLVALIRDPQALLEDCRNAQVVISPEPARRCPAPVVLDHWHLRRDGAHALYLDGGRVRIDSVRAHRGSRPWTGP
ncbi:MAG: DUF4131 domain-containing protein [Azospirillum sp.]|nr:DUF4131 domain-containing protein [Azospirillum sp.]